MKKNYLLLAGVLVCALAFAGGRDESPKASSGMAVVRKGISSYKLIYKSEQASDVKVKIYNEKNVLVFSETIRNSNGFIRPYDFWKLGEGEYTIKLDNGTGWLMEKVKYESGQQELLAHLTKLNDGRILLSVPGYGEDRLSINVLNSLGETIHHYENKVSGDFAEVFNVSHVSGPVSFEITNQRGVSTTLN
jgi:hypothetical protein